MAITYGFFNSLNGDRKYNADQMSEYFKGLISDGVFESIGGAMQVLADSGLTVNVSSGRMVIDCKWLDNDSTFSITLNAAHVTLNRYTAIVAQLDRSNRLMQIYAKDGANATSPVYPTLQNDGVITEKCLAYIYVPAGATSISQSNITDTRANTNVCGWITGIVDQVDTSTLFLQWQTAYQENIAAMQQWETQQKAAFESWLSTLTSQLTVGAYIKQFSKVVTGGSGVSGIIPLNMSGYTYEASDVFFVNINGLLGFENYDWFLDTSGSTPSIHVNTNMTVSGHKVEIKVLKSQLGTATI